MRRANQSVSHHRVINLVAELGLAIAICLLIVMLATMALNL
jgi:hypothetical protein